MTQNKERRRNVMGAIFCIILLIGIVIAVITNIRQSDCVNVCKANNMTFYAYYPKIQTCACTPNYVMTFKIIDIQKLRGSR